MVHIAMAELGFHYNLVPTFVVEFSAGANGGGVTDLGTCSRRVHSSDTIVMTPWGNLRMRLTLHESEKKNLFNTTLLCCDSDVHLRPRGANDGG